MSPIAKVRPTRAIVLRPRGGGRRLLQHLDHRERLLDVALHPDLRHEDMYDGARLVDDEGRATRHQAERRLDPVERAHLAVRVGEQRHRKAVLAGEAIVRGARVGANTDDVGPGLDEGLVVVAKGAGLDRAAGRVVLGIEEEHDGPAAQHVGQREGLAVRPGEREVGGLVASVEGHAQPASRRPAAVPGRGGESRVTPPRSGPYSRAGATSWKFAPTPAFLSLARPSLRRTATR